MPMLQVGTSHSFYSCTSLLLQASCFKDLFEIFLFLFLYIKKAIYQYMLPPIKLPVVKATIYSSIKRTEPRGEN